MPRALIKIYKAAGRTFLTNLYAVSSDLFTDAELDDLAWPVAFEGADPNWGEEYWQDVELRHGGDLVVLAKAVRDASSQARLRPEMMLALTVAVVGRKAADDWYDWDRSGRLQTAANVMDRDGHSKFTSFLLEALEILGPEFVRWHGETAAASLRGVKVAMGWIESGNWWSASVPMGEYTNSFLLTTRP